MTFKQFSNTNTQQNTIPIQL